MVVYLVYFSVVLSYWAMWKTETGCETRSRSIFKSWSHGRWQILGASSIGKGRKCRGDRGRRAVAFYLCHQSGTLLMLKRCEHSRPLWAQSVWIPDIWAICLHDCICPSLHFPKPSLLQPQRMKMGNARQLHWNMDQLQR